MKHLLYEYLDWDSRLLDFQCGLIKFRGVSHNTNQYRLVDNIMKVVEDNKDIDFITIKLPVDFPIALGVLATTGIIKKGVLENVLQIICFPFHPDCRIKMVEVPTQYFQVKFILPGMILGSTQERRYLTPKRGGHHSSC